MYRVTSAICKGHQTTANYYDIKLGGMDATAMPVARDDA